jgi:hypothetical protein
MNRKYKYQDDDTILELIAITGFIYRFKCGHWCTDLVFNDLINCKTGLPNWRQPKLFS